MNSLWEIYKRFESDDHVFTYAGHFSDSITNLLIDLKEEQQADQDLKKSYVRRSSYLLVECFQNVVRHGNEVENVKDKFNFFQLRTKRDHQLIASSNPVIEKDKEILTDILNNLHNKSIDEIKALYTHTLSEGSATERGGGGLGLIDIAKKTGRSPLWDISIGKSGANEFCIQIEMEAVLSDSTKHNVQETKEVRDYCFENNILLFRKGGFTQAEIMPIFEMIKNNKEKSDGHIPYLTIELMQNLQRHAKDKANPQGIFLMQEVEGGISIEAGNIIDKERKESLKVQLDQLKGLDAKQLKGLYRAKLMSDEKKEDGGAGIGLIEVFRHANGKVDYSFNEMEDGNVFYSIKVYADEL